MSEARPEPTPLQSAAIALHEGFDAYVKAGFTRAEALQIVLMQITVAWKNQEGEPG